MNTTPIPRPLPNSYWATPLLLAAEYPGAWPESAAAHHLDLLLAAGIRDFYDLTGPTEPLAPYEDLLRARAAHLGLAAESVRFRRFPVPEAGTPAPKRLAEVLAALEDSASTGRRAVVHGRGGLECTAVVVGCHLRQHFGLGGDEALARMAEEWQGAAQTTRVPQLPKTDEQVAFVRAFEPVLVPAAVA